MLIACDIGGTKTDLAIFLNEAGPLVPLAQTRVPSADFPSLQAIVKKFLAKERRPVDRASPFTRQLLSSSRRLCSPSRARDALRISWRGFRFTWS